jgi:AraC family transcriptional regulator
MTLQAPSQSFQSPVAAFDGPVEARSFQDVLAQFPSAPPANLQEARRVIARLAKLTGAEVSWPASEPKASSEVGIGGLSAWKARKIIAHIDERLDRVIYNTELAGVANLSVSHFSRAFKRTFGESARAYIMRRRISVAQELIGRGKQTLADVALACGFADQAHMTRVFGRLVGKSPSRWRRAQAVVLQ